MGTGGGLRAHLRVPCVLAALTLIAACSPWTGPFDGHYESGPDQPWADETGTSTCTPRPPGATDRLTWGFNGLPNRTDRLLTLDRVELVNPRGVRLAGAGVYEVGRLADGTFLLPGITQGFPPVGDEPHERAVAETMRLAPGATVPPHDDEEQSFGLAVGLVLGEQEGSFESIRIEYHDSTGLAYRSETHDALRVLAADEPSCS